MFFIEYLNGVDIRIQGQFFLKIPSQSKQAFTFCRQLGHKDLKMTMRYYRSRPEQVADLLDKG